MLTIAGLKNNNTLWLVQSESWTDYSYEPVLFFSFFLNAQKDSRITVGLNHSNDSFSETNWIHQSEHWINNMHGSARLGQNTEMS